MKRLLVAPALAALIPLSASAQNLSDAAFQAAVGGAIAKMRAQAQQEKPAPEAPQDKPAPQAPKAVPPGHPGGGDQDLGQLLRQLLGGGPDEEQEKEEPFGGDLKLSQELLDKLVAIAKDEGRFVPPSRENPEAQYAVMDVVGDHEKAHEVYNVVFHGVMDKQQRFVAKGIELEYTKLTTTDGQPGYGVEQWSVMTRMDGTARHSAYVAGKFVGAFEPSMPDYTHPDGTDPGVIAAWNASIKHWTERKSR